MIQVLQYGDDDSGVQEISLWYFYDARPIDEKDWESTLKDKIGSLDGRYHLEEYEFYKAFEDTAPIPLVEKTYYLNSKASETTQFIMSYIRDFHDGDGQELLLISAEEKVNKQHSTIERELVRSTGVVLNRIDLITN